MLSAKDETDVLPIRAALQARCAFWEGEACATSQASSAHQPPTISQLVQLSLYQCWKKSNVLFTQNFPQSSIHLTNLTKKLTSMMETLATQQLQLGVTSQVFIIREKRREKTSRKSERWEMTCNKSHDVNRYRQDSWSALKHWTSRGAGVELNNHPSRVEQKVRLSDHFVPLCSISVS